LQIQHNVPLAPLTTFQVGGPARFFVEARTAQEVRAAVDWARAENLRLFVLGGGSNLVVSDGGWPGLVLRVGLRGIEGSRQDGKYVLRAAAGEDWDGLVAAAVAQNLAGVECMSGIPGTVGATPIQNVGAYGQEVAETITEVEVLDLESGQVRGLSNPACGFAYRTSIFNTTHQGRYLVLGVSFALRPEGAPRLEYADLKKYFVERNLEPTLAQTREAVRQIRLSKAMLIVPGDDDCRSAGSFFKNPIITAEEYGRLSSMAKERGLATKGLKAKVPKYPASEGKVKVPAAWLVEQAGFHKGYTRGAVGISRRHALAVVNRGGATAVEIVILKDEIQEKVAGMFGIRLEPEPVFVGFE